MGWEYNNKELLSIVVVKQVFDEMPELNHDVFNFNRILSSSFHLPKNNNTCGNGGGSGFSSKEEEELERKVYDFMKNSNTPNHFPTKKHLLDAGRLDLVTAISNTGGWLAFGWDDDDQEDPPPHFDSTASLSDDDAEQQEEEEDTGGGGVDGILTRLHNHRLRTRQQKLHHVADKSTQQRVSTTYFSDFQAAEIHYGKEDLQEKTQQLHNKEISPDRIRSRLQHMEFELSSALDTLRSKSTHTLYSEVHESSASELQQLSDVWEFQENELMKAEAKLRSIRAKLAVFEGKIALSKLVEEKQRRIDSAHRTLQLLRTTCIFWTHSASEVLLVGSFDGWTSQIKFIVDGIWRVDPMLPVVHINGYENNSLVVRE
ncbi:protein PTST homolog 2, chloroplastic [Tanacetum coccineum]